MKFISLFAGIGGFDLGFERAGMECLLQVEINPQCRKVLGRHWPNVPQAEDVTDAGTVELIRRLAPDLICGGDPCPKHSRARSNGASKHPDLSGWFLSLAGGSGAEWVVRENVPAPTVEHFAAALEVLGYGVAVVRLNSAKITGQCRQRDFVVGCHSLTSGELARAVFSDCKNGAGPYETRLGTRQIAPALTTHRTRYDSRDCYVWSPRWGMRILESGERERLAGFPVEWTSGFSPATRARMLGNSVVPGVAEWIGRRILETENT